MWVKHHHELDWVPAEQAGVERALLRAHEAGGRTYLVRMAPGSRIPSHLHYGAEEVFVLEGAVSIGQAALQAGDYYFANAGEIHDVTAPDASLLLIVSYQPIEFIPETIEV